MPNVAIYELIQDGEVRSFHTDPWTLDAGQTQNEVVLNLPDVPGEKPDALRGRAMSAYESRLTLSLDIPDWKPGTLTTIPVNTPVTVLISSTLNIASITLRMELLGAAGETLGTLTRAIALTAGSGSRTLQFDNPAIVVITPDDRATFTPAGRGALIFEVTAA